MSGAVDQGQNRARLRIGWLAAPAAVALVAAAPYVVPQAREAYEQFQARNNDDAGTALALRRDFTDARLRDELAAALDADDIDLADSLIALAEQQGMALPPDLRQRHDDASGVLERARRGASDFAHGAFTGAGEGGAGLAGTVVADLSGVGDVRDLIIQGQRAANGEEVDQLIVGLSAVGLVITGVTIASLGSSMPARAGVSTVKSVAKSGRLSKPLAATFGRMIGQAVDTKALSAAAGAASRFDLAGARAMAVGAVRPQGMKALTRVVDDVAVIGRRGGVRSAQEVLAVARSEAEIARIARLAEVRGPATRGVMRVLGRAAIVAGGALVTMVGWMVAGIGWLFSALMLTLFLVRLSLRWMGRLWRWIMRPLWRMTTGLLRAT